jgi:transcriptional regulator with XRE-family HTH domain
VIAFRLIRDLAGLTQQDVAEWARVTDRSARRWESTHTPPAEVEAWVRDILSEVIVRAKDPGAGGEGSPVSEYAVARVRVIMAALEEVRPQSL